LLSFPGGKFESIDTDTDEDVIKTAVKREVLEEVGLDLIDPVKYVTSSFFQDTKTNQNVVNVVYYCKLEKTKVEVKANPREVPEYYWLTVDEILEKENCPPWLIKYLKGIKEIIHEQ